MGKSKHLLIIITIILVSFGYGISVGHYKWQPFQVIYELKNSILVLFKIDQPLLGDQEVLKEAFTASVNEEDLYYPEISSTKEVLSFNSSIFTPQQGFETAYEKIKISDAQQVSRKNGRGPVIKINFAYLDKTYEAFAYGTLPKICEKNSTSALVIPGSGLNQSLEIFQEDNSNYHRGIARVFRERNTNLYVLIKPNEDFRAWHNGEGRKIDGSFIWNWHLNRFGSYSVSYLVESIAFVKWMKSCFKTTVVAGLSQGGAATLLNGIQTSPTIAIVASGYSVVSNIAEASGHNQIIGVPGYVALMDPVVLKRRLDATPTTWFFSWGKKENGVYKYDALNAISAKALSEISSIHSVIHDGDHEFPIGELRDFLNKNLSEK